MLEVIQIPVLNDNYIYLIHDDKEQKTAVVDPALAEPVLKELKKRSWNLDYIFNTHHHFDHIGGNKELIEKTGCQNFGYQGDQHRIPTINIPLLDQETINFGSHKIKIMFTPGHTLGHICYFFENEKILFCGDTLFAMGCGRMFEGNPKQMLESLISLKKLPAETKVYCAHEYTYSNAKFAMSVDKNNHQLIERMKEVTLAKEKGVSTIPTTIQKEIDTNPFFRTDNQELVSNLDLVGKEEWEVFKVLRETKDNF